MTEQAQTFGEERRLVDSEGRVHVFKAKAFMPTPEAPPAHRRTLWEWVIESE